MHGSQTAPMAAVSANLFVPIEIATNHEGIVTRNLNTAARQEVKSSISSNRPPQQLQENVVLEPAASSDGLSSRSGSSPGCNLGFAYLM
jgi:hypothetical protein